MASYDHWGGQNGNVFPGRLSFQTNSSAGNTTSAVDTTAWAYYPQRTTTTASTNTTGGQWLDFNFPYPSQSETTATFDFQETATGTSWANPSWTVSASSFSGAGKLKNALMKIFEKVPKDLIKTKEDRRLVRAKEKSEKLLKEWMTPAEYKALKEKGEVEVPSMEDDDVIFIVKRDPNEMVDVKKNGKKTHKLCAVAEDMDYPVGDQLLSKIALIKTDEKRFKRTAIKHASYF